MLPLTASLPQAGAGRVAAFSVIPMPHLKISIVTAMRVARSSVAAARLLTRRLPAIKSFGCSANRTPRMTDDRH
jgi:hypothetical protein